MQSVYKYADYITFNISSPNTANLRDLQEPDNLKRFLSVLKREHVYLERKYQKYVPLVIKVSSDLNVNHIIDISRILINYEIDGVILSNTISNHSFSEQGGASGLQVKSLAQKSLDYFALSLKGKIPIIASGGILTVEDAKERLNSGASLVQLFTGLIYTGPKLIEDIIKSL